MVIGVEMKVRKRKTSKSSVPSGKRKKIPVKVDGESSEEEAHSSNEQEEEKKVHSFRELGIDLDLCEQIENLGWTNPTPVQAQVLSSALAGRDIISLAETGSGKTGAFAISLLNTLRSSPRGSFGLVLGPTRELASQIRDQFMALGGELGLRTVLLVGGSSKDDQIVELGLKPHIIIATPGRLLFFLETFPGINLNVKFLVLDEADRMLSIGFEQDLAIIMRSLPRNRQTLLFSATLTSNVRKLQKAQLVKPVWVKISTKFDTSPNLTQNMAFVPFDLKTEYCVFTLQNIEAESVIVFCSTCTRAFYVASILRAMGKKALHITSKLTQAKRDAAVSAFRSRQANILVGTDVISRGLDIPDVDYVVNFDLPTKAKVYVHRVGRTARAGNSGTSLTFVTQFEIEEFLLIEKALRRKMTKYDIQEEEVMAMNDEIERAMKIAKKERRLIMEEEKEKEMAINKRQANSRKDEDKFDVDKEGQITIRRQLNRKKQRFPN